MKEIPKEIEIVGIDPQVYLAALEFHETAKEIGDKRRTKAEIVNYTLAIELYFKSILSRTSLKLKDNTPYPEYDRKMETQKGHKLYDELFLSLTKKDQDSLIKLYKEKYSGELILDLKEMNNDFIDYRYAHEKNALTTTLFGIKNIPDLLRGFIESEMSKENYVR